MYSTRIGDGSQSNFAVGNSQCHEPPMTGNGIFDGLYMFIPPIKMVIFLGDGLFLFTDLTSHSNSILFGQQTMFFVPSQFSHDCVANLLAPPVGDLPDGVRQPRWWYRLGMDSWAIFFCKPPKRKKSKIQLWLMDNYPITNLYYGTINIY